MTSSMFRSMLVAKRSLMIVGFMWGSFLQDLRSVVVLGVRDAHEAEARRAIKLARIEEDGGDVHLALQLLEQRRCPIDREECSCPHDKDDVAERIRIGRDALSD